MFLFIFESIGTSELILIGLVALIVFGPRRLPQLARTLGKTMADFRRTTQDFKTTWEREVDFEEEKRALKQTFEDPEPENKISRAETVERSSQPQNALSAPEIKEVSAETFTLPEKEIQTATPPQIETAENGKQNWL